MFSFRNVAAAAVLPEPEVAPTIHLLRPEMFSKLFVLPWPGPTVCLCLTALITTYKHTGDQLLNTALCSLLPGPWLCQIFCSDVKWFSLSESFLLPPSSSVQSVRSESSRCLGHISNTFIQRRVLNINLPFESSIQGKAVNSLLRVRGEQMVVIVMLWEEMDGRRLLLEIVQNFLRGNFRFMIDVLFLHNNRASFSWHFSFLRIISTTKQNIDESQWSGGDQTTNTGRVCSSGFPGLRGGERTLTLTSVCCSPPGKTGGETRTGPGLTGSSPILFRPNVDSQRSLAKNFR